MVSTIDEDSELATPSKREQLPPDVPTIRIRFRRRLDRRPSKRLRSNFTIEASTLGRTRDALRHATATSSNGVAEANLLRRRRRGPFTSPTRDGSSRLDDRRDDVPNDAFTLDVDATTSRSVDTPGGGKAGSADACRASRLPLRPSRANDARVAPIHHRPSRPRSFVSRPHRCKVHGMIATGVSQALGGTLATGVPSPSAPRSPNRLRGLPRIFAFSSMPSRVGSIRTSCATSRRRAMTSSARSHISTTWRPPPSRARARAPASIRWERSRRRARRHLRCSARETPAPRAPVETRAPQVDGCRRDQARSRRRMDAARLGDDAVVSERGGGEFCGNWARREAERG